MNTAKTDAEIAAEKIEVLADVLVAMACAPVAASRTALILALRDVLVFPDNVDARLEYVESLVAPPGEPVEFEVLPSAKERRVNVSLPGALFLGHMMDLIAQKQGKFIN